MVTVLRDANIRLENRSLLMRRKSMADQGVAVSDSRDERELADILRALSEHEVQRAADVWLPLFMPAVVGRALDSIVENSFIPSADHGDREVFLRRMNEELLMNRWRMCQAPSVTLEIHLGMTLDAIEWFRACTFERIKAVVDYSESLTSLSVTPRYVYMAAKGLHLQDRQRDVMALMAA